jgi:predicted CoA-binding protein
MQTVKQRIVVLGASANSDRYSNRAVRLLLLHGHEVIPVHPKEKLIIGLPVTHSLAAVRGHVDTLCMYVSPEISTTLESAILKLHPSRVIFNPGTENRALEECLRQHGIPSEEACTLVMLDTYQF